MRFKGFWTELWDLSKHSCRFLKDYWLAYIIAYIACMVFWGIASMSCLSLVSKYENRKNKKEDEEYEDFLK